MATDDAYGGRKPPAFPIPKQLGQFTMLYVDANKGRESNWGGGGGGGGGEYVITLQDYQQGCLASLTCPPDSRAVNQITN